MKTEQRWRQFKKHSADLNGQYGKERKIDKRHPTSPHKNQKTGHELERLRTLENCRKTLGLFLRIDCTSKTRSSAQVCNDLDEVTEWMAMSPVFIRVICLPVFQMYSLSHEQPFFLPQRRIVLLVHSWFQPRSFEKGDVSVGYGWLTMMVERTRSSIHNSSEYAK